jgi:hypothetical protein
MPQVEPKVVQSVAERSSKILADFAQKQAQSLSAAMRDDMGIAKAYMDLYAKMASDPAPPLLSVAPQVPRAVGLIVDRALAFSRGRRPNSDHVATSTRSLMP